jgi:hypothetical protein
MLDSKKLKPTKRKKIEIELKFRILSLLDANGPTMNLFCSEVSILCYFIKRSHANRVKEKIRVVHGKNGHISKKKVMKEPRVLEGLVRLFFSFKLALFL